MGGGRRGARAAHSKETQQGQATGCFHSPISNCGRVQGRPATKPRGPVCVRGPCLSIGVRGDLEQDISQGEMERWSVAWDGLSRWVHPPAHLGLPQGVPRGGGQLPHAQPEAPPGLVALLSLSA